jgi:hypothetical protein
MVARGDSVTVKLPEPGMFGDWLEVPATVAAINSDGTINALLYDPNHERDEFMTGIRSEASWLALPERSPERNLAYFV